MRKWRNGAVPHLVQEILQKHIGRHREITPVDCGFWAERKYGENQEVKVVFTNNSLSLKPEWQAASCFFENGFKSFINCFSRNNISISKGSEIWSEAVVGKQEKYKAMWALVWALCCPIIGLCTDAMEAQYAGSTPAGSGSWEPSIAVRVPKNPWKLIKGPGHSSYIMTWLIPLFFFFFFEGGEWSTRAVESLLHSGLDIQFVLSMVYWLSFTQIYHPGGFIYFVDKFEFDTTKFKPEIVSYTTIYASNQISATSLQRIRVQSLMVKLPKSSPHYFSMDELSLFLSM